jgi:transglutaminase-like putative cysteine protease
MKKYFSKAVSVVLVATMIASTLGGCGKTTSTKTADNSNKSEENSEENTSVDNIEISQLKSSSGIELIQTLKSSYVAAGNDDVQYSSPMYSVPEDFEFEFEASKEAGYVAYKAFKVYPNTDISRSQSYFSVCDYDDSTGKITVRPSGSIRITYDGQKHTDDGTWGSYNKLYLVQYIDLETGEDLAEPVITPFTVEHDIDAPVVTQGVAEDNTYQLSWNEVSGATEYRVYRHYGDNNFELEATTTDTSIKGEEFKSQKTDDNYSSLVDQDLLDWGYSEDAVDADKTLLMNSALTSIEYDTCYYTVIAVNSAGETSGISNIVNAADMASALPYEVTDRNIELDINSVEDLPTYIDVTTLDGSTIKMIIEYHGCQTYLSTTDDKTVILKPHIVNTNFKSITITEHGLTYDELMSQASKLTDREDKLVVTTPGSDSINTISEAPSKDRTKENEEVQEKIDNVTPEVNTITDEDANSITEDTSGASPSNRDVSINTGAHSTDVTPSDDSTELASNDEQTDSSNASSSETASNTTSGSTTDPSTGVVTTPEGFTTVELMASVADEVNNRLSTLDSSINDVVYASNDLEAWIALCLLTNMEIVPVPTAVFPEAANTEYLQEVFVEAYRQNPTCGVMNNLGIAYDYESLVVGWTEDADSVLSKTNTELTKSKELAQSVVTSSMSDSEKVIAINNYICDNATYDYSSATDDYDMNNLSEQFIDSHTPYGVLVSGTGVCESYAESFMLIARFAGLDARSEVGTLSGGPHEWVKVNVNGSWCIVDPTNNDNDDIPNALLNVTDEQAKDTLVSDNSANISTLSATDDSYEYYKSIGRTASTEDEAIDILLSQMNSGKAYVRIPSSFGSSELNNIAQAIAESYETDLLAGMFGGVLAVVQQ